MLPLSLLNAATGCSILVELKNGETYNGQLSSIDPRMNVTMKDVTRTSKDGDQFWTISEMYIRGNNVKYLRIPDTVLDTVAEEKQAREAARNRNRAGRGRGRGRGGGRGRGRGGRSGRVGQNRN